jgi:hypothetical protein
VEFINLVIKCPLGLPDVISGSKVPLGLPVSKRHNSFPDTPTSFIVSFSFSLLDPQLPDGILRSMLAGSLVAAPSLFLSFSDLSLASSMAAAQGIFGSKRIRPFGRSASPSAAAPL